MDNKQLGQFNAGGTHEENPNSGIPQGPNATVEQGETSTKTPSGKYIYSNRLYINEDLVKQFNLPNSIKGKTFADASKVIDKPFKDKNSNPDKLTHKEHLDRLKQAQETLKAEEQQKQQAMMQNMQQMPDVSQNPTPEGMEEYSEPQNNPQEEMMEQPQASAYGGFIKRYDTGGDLSNMAYTGADMYMPGAGQALKAGDQIGSSIGSAIGGDKGDQIGQLISPTGTLKGIGNAFQNKNINDIPTIGLISGNENTAQKQKRLQMFNAARNVNSQFSDKFKEGGYITSKPSMYDEGGPLPQEDPSKLNFTNNFGQPFDFTNNFGKSLEKDPYINKNITAAPKTSNKGDFDVKQKQPDNNFTNNFDQPFNFTNNFGKSFGEDPYASKNINSSDKGIVINDLSEKNGYAYPNLAPAANTTNKGVDPNANANASEGMSIAGKTLDYLDKNGGKFLKYAPIGMNAFQLSKLKKPQGVSLDRLSNRYKPTYLDEASIQNNISNEMNNTVAGLTNASGGSGAALRAGLLGANVGRIKGMNDAYSKMKEYNAGQNSIAQQFNLGVDKSNIEQSNNQLEINDRNQANYRSQKSKLLGSIGTDLGEVGKEEVNKNQLASALGYTYDGKYYIDKKSGNKLTHKQILEKQNNKKYNFSGDENNFKPISFSPNTNLNKIGR